jgi:rifampin ADP-ribosylating transferase
LNEYSWKGARALEQHRHHTNGDQRAPFKNCATPRFAEAPPPPVATEPRPTTTQATPFAGTFFHGTKADLKAGDMISPGFSSNFSKRNTAAFVYLTTTLDAAIWGAELAAGSGPDRIYVVEPTGAHEDDPNLTDKKFPGNPTKSYRTRDALRVVGEVINWTGHSAEQLDTMRSRLAELERLGVEAIED